jgi:pfkB family carbohydrate kinase
MASTWVVSGLLFADLVFKLPEPPRPGAEVWAAGFAESPGGIANFAVALSRLGLRTGLAATLGDDDRGDRLWSELSNEGVDLSLSRRVAGWPTPLTVALSYAGDRALVTHGSEPPLTADQLISSPPAAAAVAAATSGCGPTTGWPRRTPPAAGRVRDLTLCEVRQLDAAYNFVPGRSAVPGLPPDSYPLRGVRTTTWSRPRVTRPRTSRSRPCASAPHVPAGADQHRDQGHQRHRPAVVPAQRQAARRPLNEAGRTDVIVTSFNDTALATFHLLAPQIPLAPGMAGIAAYFLAGVRPIDGTVGLQIPVQFNGIPRSPPRSSSPARTGTVTRCTSGSAAARPTTRRRTT